MKKCCIENCNNNVWSNGFCKNHITKKPLNQCMVKPSLTSKNVHNDGYIIRKKLFKPKKKLLAYRPKGYEAMYEEILKMRNFFLSIWKKRPHRSEVSGEYLGSEPMSTYFHHILPKNKYPESCLDEENIVLLSLEEHSNVENDMYKYEEVNKRREQLKLKYNIS